MPTGFPRATDDSRQALAEIGRARSCALVVILVLCGTAFADAPIGFSHEAHDDAAKAKAIKCTGCHQIRNGLLVGKPDHATCFGDCHGPPPTREPVDAKRIALCVPCHAESALATPKNRPALAAKYPPYSFKPDHALQLGHQTHKDIACGQCHEKKGVAHKRCVGCHDGVKAKPMNECVHCHTRGTGERPQLAEGDLRVARAFSHGRHATRGAAKQCATCHPGIADTNSLVLPRPEAPSCAVTGCHDGQPTFGITLTCRKCHQDVPTTKFDVARPDKRFSHVHPKHVEANLPCAACHSFAKAGEIVVAGHAACVDCHADDFTKRKPKYCGACHNGTEPWRPLVADRLPPETSEFGATLDHGKHLQRACTTCHSLATGRVELRAPRGHSACTSSGCHAIAGGPAPQLGQCETCHKVGFATQRERTRLGAAWSVRATFSHASHRTTTGGAEVACTRCHTDLTSASVLSLAVPTKAACADCHDGGIAFKVTGTKCTRCHPGVKR